MPYRRLFIWVEGPDDTRFFDRVIKPLFSTSHDWVEVREYSGLPRNKLRDFLRGIRAMRADCLFVVDLNQSPCISERKRRLRTKLRGLRDEEILVVCPEIEAWYLAGLGPEARKTLRLKWKGIGTDDCTKERFNAVQPVRFESRIDFLIEILKVHAADRAMQANSSFRYCVERHGLR